MDYFLILFLAFSPRFSVLFLQLYSIYLLPTLKFPLHALSGFQNRLLMYSMYFRAQQSFSSAKGIGFWENYLRSRKIISIFARVLACILSVIFLSFFLWNENPFEFQTIFPFIHLPNSAFFLSFWYHSLYFQWDFLDKKNAGKCFSPVIPSNPLKRINFWSKKSAIS